MAREIHHIGLSSPADPKLSGDSLPAGVFCGGDEIPGGTFHRKPGKPDGEGSIPPCTVQEGVKV